MDQLKQAQLTSDFSNVATETLKPATASPNAVRPRWVLNATMALFIGLLGGCATLFVQSYLKEATPSAEDVQEHQQFEKKTTCG